MIDLHRCYTLSQTSVDRLSHLLKYIFSKIHLFVEVLIHLLDNLYWVDLARSTLNPRTRIPHLLLFFSLLLISCFLFYFQQKKNTLFLRVSAFKMWDINNPGVVAFLFFSFANEKITVLMSEQIGKTIKRHMVYTYCIRSYINTFWNWVFLKTRIFFSGCNFRLFFFHFTKKCCVQKVMHYLKNPHENVPWQSYHESTKEK